MQDKITIEFKLDQLREFNRIWPVLVVLSDPKNDTSKMVLSIGWELSMKFTKRAIGNQKKVKIALKLHEAVALKIYTQAMLKSSDYDWKNDTNVYLHNEILRVSNELHQKTA